MGYIYECGKLLNRKGFPLRLKGAVYKRYIWPKFCMEGNNGAGKTARCA